MVQEVHLEFRKNNGDSFGTLGGLGYDHTWSANCNSFTQWWTQRFAMTITSHVAACAWQAGFTQGPVELPALAPSRRANRRGKRIGPEPALRPERAGSDGRPGAPAWPRQRERFAAVAPASRALSIERINTTHVN